jgi:hypothetical protein
MSEALCLDGPKDGQWIECEYPQLVCYESPAIGLPEQTKPSELVSTMSVRQFHYRRMRFGDSDFWVPGDGHWGPAEIVKKLAAGYRGTVRSI